MHSRICIQTDDFDMAEEYQQLRQQKAEIGAVVCFVGLVRELENNASIDKLTLEHYPGMTEQLLQAIIDEAESLGINGSYRYSQSRGVIAQ